jgi:hypothetical protein
MAPGRSARFIVSHRLAGTVRAGHDRSHGLRNADVGIPCGGAEVIDEGVTGLIVDTLEDNERRKSNSSWQGR